LGSFLRGKGRARGRLVEVCPHRKKWRIGSRIDLQHEKTVVVVGLIASLLGSRWWQRGADKSRKRLAAARAIVVRTVSYLDDLEIGIGVTSRCRKGQFFL
jgi:hypothetical protein